MGSGSPTLDLRLGPGVAGQKFPAYGPGEGPRWQALVLTGPLAIGRAVLCMSGAPDHYAPDHYFEVPVPLKAGETLSFGVLAYAGEATGIRYEYALAATTDGTLVYAGEPARRSVSDAPLVTDDPAIREQSPPPYTFQRDATSHHVPGRKSLKYLPDSTMRPRPHTAPGWQTFEKFLAEVDTAMARAVHGKLTADGVPRPEAAKPEPRKAAHNFAGRCEHCLKYTTVSVGELDPGEARCTHVFVYAPEHGAAGVVACTSCAMRVDMRDLERALEKAGLDPARRYDRNRNHLADCIGRLAGENTELLVENARLRRELEKLDKLARRPGGVTFPMVRKGGR